MKIFNEHTEKNIDLENCIKNNLIKIDLYKLLFNYYIRLSLYCVKPTIKIIYKYNENTLQENVDIFLDEKKLMYQIYFNMNEKRFLNGLILRMKYN